MDNNSTRNNSTPSGYGSIFQLYFYPIYLMSKSSVIPYVMAMSRLMIRGNGFTPLPMKGPVFSNTGDTQGCFQALPSLDLCTCHGFRNSYPFLPTFKSSALPSPEPFSAVNPSLSLTGLFSPWLPTRYLHLLTSTLHRSCSTGRKANCQ